MVSTTSLLRSPSPGPAAASSGLTIQGSTSIECPSSSSMPTTSWSPSSSPPYSCKLILHLSPPVFNGFKSGLLPGHLMREMWNLSKNHLLAILALWLAALSCKKCVVLCYAMKSSGLSVPHLIHHLSPVQQLQTPWPLKLKQAQAMTLGGCLPSSWWTW
jgi:hypothetical protein